MIATAADHTARAALGRHMLAIQDTTEINFSGHEGSKRGFGVVGNGKDIGFFLHPVLVTEAGSGPSDVGHCGGHCRTGGRLRAHASKSAAWRAQIARGATQEGTPDRHARERALA